MALPILKQYRYHATVFLIGKMIRQEMPIDPSPIDFQLLKQDQFSLPMGYDPLKFSFLTWSEVATMADSGYVDFGSHTYNSHTVPHTNIPALSRMLFAQIDSDFSAEENVFMNHGVKMMPFFAYPEGYTNVVIRGVLRQRGYKLGVDSNPGSIGLWADPLLIPRFSMESGIPLNLQQILKK